MKKKIILGTSDAWPWVDCTSDQETQHIILKIVGFLIREHFFFLNNINGICRIVLQTYICCFDKLLRVFFFFLHLHRRQLWSLFKGPFLLFLRICWHFKAQYNRMHLNFTIDPIHLSTYPSLNTQSSIRRPLCSTFRFENLSISPKKCF